MDSTRQPIIGLGCDIKPVRNLPRLTQRVVFKNDAYSYVEYCTGEFDHEHSDWIRKRRLLVDCGEYLEPGPEMIFEPVRARITSLSLIPPSKALLVLLLAVLLTSCAAPWKSLSPVEQAAIILKTPVGPPIQFEATGEPIL